MSEPKCLAPDDCIHEELCFFCAAYTGETLDRYYVSKVAQGLITEPVAEVLSEKEMEWTLQGREHGDGRRSDQYVPRDPDLWIDQDDLKALH